MRILCVIPFYKPAYIYGGPIHSVPTLCEGLSRLGCDVTVFTTNANGAEDLTVAPAAPYTLDGVKVFFFKRDLPGSYFFSTQLGNACFKSINRQAFDVVYIVSNWAFPFLPACLAAKRADVPFVLSPRKSFSKIAWQGNKILKKKLYHTVLERNLINHAARIHYTTVIEENDSRWLGLKPASILLPNPVDLPEFTTLPAKGQFRQRMNIPEHKKILLFLGRVEPIKGLDILIKAFSKVTRVFPDVLLIVAGPEEDGYSRTLQDLAKSLNETNNIIFTGLLTGSQKLEALVDADLFLLTSYSENFGMAVTEAMACNLPVIVSEQVGVSEYIKQADAGIVVPIDVDQIANNVTRLLNNPTEAASYSKRAGCLVRNDFAQIPISQKMLEALTRIL